MSNQQVQSMKCSNEIGCEGNYNAFMIIISSEFFHFFNGFTFEAEFGNPIILRNLWFVMSILFVVPRRRAKKSWLSRAA